MTQQIRFDEALQVAVDLVKSHLPVKDTLLVRDVLGCFQILIKETTVDNLSDDKINAFTSRFKEELGVYSVSESRLVMWVDEESPLNGMYEMPGVWISQKDEEPGVSILDRQVTGREWLLPPSIDDNPQPPRAVFFGIKGGVGRSTALAVLAWKFSRKGKKVLIVDLDLESPGLGPMLLPKGRPQKGDTCVPGWPTFGVADWLVEDAVGLSDEMLIREMIASSPIATTGDIVIVPAAGGLLNQSYISKLSRTYLDLPHATGNIELFGDRLARMLDQLEKHTAPDVVLIDCRAGLHDISAVALTRLGALCFLFAVDTKQTWEGYRHLFRHWQRWPERLRKIRENLATVGAMAPSNKDLYLSSFCEQSSDVFSEIYDESADTAEPTMNFAPMETEAPHYPMLIKSHGDFATFDPQNNPSQLDTASIDFVFGDFIQKAVRLLFPNGEA